MKRIRKNSYVAQELRRRQYPADQKAKETIINVISSIPIVAGSEAILFALLLM